MKREGEKLTILNNYENYLKEYEVNKNNSELELSKYNIKKIGILFRKSWLCRGNGIF